MRNGSSDYARAFEEQIRDQVAAVRDKLGNASSQLVVSLSERCIPVVHTQFTQNEHAG